MKKIFILFTSSILGLSSYAQQVPNGGFENWNGNTNPINWSTLANGYAGIPGVEVFAQKDTAPQQQTEGSVSLKMVNDSIPGQGTLRSYVGLGAIHVQGAPTFDGVPYTIRPDTLKFAYFYTPGAGSDTGLVTVDFRQAGVSMFGGAKTFALPASQGSFASLPLASLFTVAGAPDTLSIVFKSGKSASGREYGSVLILDDVKVSMKIATGLEQISASAAVSAYPNPSANTLNIAVRAEEVGSSIQMMDLTGRVVYTGTVSSTLHTIDVRNLPAGIYALNIRSNDHLTVYEGKISVAH